MPVRTTTAQPAAGRPVRVSVFSDDPVGLDVELALSGFEAIEWPALGVPDADVVVVCVQARLAGSVPGTVRSIRESGFSGGVCVLAPALSDEAIAELMEDGAEACVGRAAMLPAHVSALARLVRARGTGSGSAEGTSFELHPNDRTVCVGGDTFCLSDTTFRILAHLANQDGRWVRTASLASTILHRSDPAAMDLIRVHVHELRRALRQHANIVQSERCLGYRICLDRRGRSGTRRRVVGP